MGVTDNIDIGNNNKIEMLSRVFFRRLSTSRPFAVESKFTPLQVAIREQKSDKKFFPDKHYEIMMGVICTGIAIGLYLNYKLPEARARTNWHPYQKPEP